jgi:hypothetical protein
MLNSFFKLILLSTIVFVLASCENTDILAPNALTVNVDESATYITNDFEKGEMVSITVNVNAPDGITIFGIDKKVNGGAAQALTLANSPAPNATSFTATYEIPVTENVGESVEIIIKATQGGGNTFTSSSYIYDVVAQGQGGGGGVFPLLRSQVTVALGSQGNTTTGSYLNTATGTVYLSEGVTALTDAQKAAIDITFGVTTGGSPTIISPDAREGLTFNNPMGIQASTTTFKTSALTSIDGVTSSGVENNVNHTSGATATQAITANSVYSYINEAGAKGYFEVVSITGVGDARVATLDVLVQNVQ